MTGIHLNTARLPCVIVTVKSAEAKTAKSRAGAAENCFNRKTRRATLPQCLGATRIHSHAQLYYTLVSS